MLTSALDTGEWSASRLGRLKPGTETRYPLIGGSKAVLDVCERRKLFLQGYETRVSQPQPSYWQVILNLKISQSHSTVKRNQPKVTFELKT